MFRLDFCILLLTSLSLNLAFSPISTDDFNLNALPEKLLGPEHFTNETEDFYSPDNTNKADIKYHPYMAGVIVKQVLPGGGVFEKKCTGSFFISKGGVLTAAHCVVYGRTKVDTNSILIRFNSNYLDRGGKTITATSVEVDRYYAKNEKGISILSDIAAIRVNAFSAPDDVKEALKLVKALPFPSNQYQALHLARERAMVRVIGYGITKESRKDNSLVEVDISLISHDRCEEMVAHLKTYVNNRLLVCAYTRGVDVCRGEGGAVMLADGLEGPLAVWSYGRNCGKNRPAFFATVNARQNGPNDYKYSNDATNKSLSRLDDGKRRSNFTWEEVIEKEDDDEGKPTNAPGGELANASNGAHLSVCSTVSTGLFVFMLIVEITSFGKNN